ncbi:MAG: PAC2 family protein [Actinomycetaceae bacterium]|nr:PAC2 family protein [Actinomycetaceae bacterium]
MEPHELIEVDRSVKYHAPILLSYLSGATDAGRASALAVDQLLTSLPVRRVATFDTDMLIDYRSHRPSVTIENWSVVDIDVPEIAIDLVQDDGGVPILVLHGPEPDAKWQRFSAAVTEFAHEAGVEICVSMMGMPAAVPHTRPTLVHLQSTDPSLVEGQPEMGGAIQFNSSANTFLQHSLANAGIEGVNFLAAVPYYMADVEYPTASLALLERMASVLDLQLPKGNIEAGSQDVQNQLKAMVAETAENSNLVKMLEQHFDEQVSDAAKAIGDFPSPEDFDDAADLKEPPEEKEESVDVDALTEAIEQFLARATDSDTPPKPDPQADRKPRHRAPKPWELDS